jgi:hypothetical protein
LRRLPASRVPKPDGILESPRFSLRDAQALCGPFLLCDKERAARGGCFSRHFLLPAYNELSSFLSLAVEYARSPHWNVDARAHKEKASRRDRYS